MDRGNGLVAVMDGVPDGMSDSFLGGGPSRVVPVAELGMEFDEPDPGCEELVTNGGNEHGAFGTGLEGLVFPHSRSHHVSEPLVGGVIKIDPTASTQNVGLAGYHTNEPGMV